MEDIKVFDLTNHRKLWLWLAENPENEKFQWPEWKENGGTLEGQTMNCFACEYVEDSCKECPIEWPWNGKSKKECDGDNGIYTNWWNATDPIKRKSLALQIANLPVKPNVVTK